ncbi:related to mef2-translation elongation mitochondrial [Ceraceosorus bombacis]|uniref:Related to mef2-translation elongation mitochondrial n=1 Tax=Ceraceosorus bombacis TaxID=401625 RepID=A0A0P1BHV9_9BASI|nr:related to mef2-translation elongation mitochondrial [Ceraceosorus bombacis]
MWTVGVRRANITLVDTPGHVDFTIEVERALRVVDACVVVLDGVAGVESQTRNNWNISARYGLRSHMVFINKLDRAGASVSRCLRSIIRTLHPQPLLLQLPIPAIKASSAESTTLAGLIDLLHLRAHTYTGEAGEVMKSLELQEAMAEGLVQEELARECKRARHALVESAASLDDELLEELLDLDASSQRATSTASAHDKVSAQSLLKALRRLVQRGTALPVLLGSAMKGIGAQDVLDYVVQLFPSPDQAGDPDASRQRGIKEESGAVWAELSPEADNGKGGRTTRRGNTSTIASGQTRGRGGGGSGAVQEATPVPAAASALSGASLDADNRVAVSINDSELSLLAFKVVHVPPPVFSMSVEARSKSDEEGVHEALSMLVRTDPSLRLDQGQQRQKQRQGWSASTFDSSSSSAAAEMTSLGSAGTGQTVLSGMGELHLEIAKGRLTEEFGANARMGSVRVSYRETLRDETKICTVSEVLDKDVLGKRLKAAITLDAESIARHEKGGGKQFVEEEEQSTGAAGSGSNSGSASASASASSPIHPDTLTPQAMRQALRAGITAALSRELFPSLLVLLFCAP